MADEGAWADALQAIVSQPGLTTVEASEVLPWLWLGGKPAAENAARDNTLDVTHMLNCCEPWCADGPNFSRLRYAGFEALDAPDYPLLLMHYDGTARLLLDQARANRGRCLVHCAMGVNRSAAIVVAYLVDRLAMDLLPAVELVKKARGCVLGNAGFRTQLVAFAKKRRRLGDTSLRDSWVACKPPEPEPESVKLGPPPKAWRKLHISSGCRVRMHICAGEWAEGRARLDEDESCWFVLLDRGGTDCVEVGSTDICAIPNTDT